MTSTIGVTLMSATGGIGFRFIAMCQSSVARIASLLLRGGGLAPPAQKFKFNSPGLTFLSASHAGYLLAFWDRLIK
jgi:hypothetical protein